MVDGNLQPTATLDNTHNKLLVPDDVEALDFGPWRDIHFYLYFHSDLPQKRMSHSTLGETRTRNRHLCHAPYGTLGG